MQALKACHQFSLDGSNGRAAWGLTFQKDPYGQPRWGGSEEELSVIASHLRAQHDLQERLRQGWRGQSGAQAGQQEDPEEGGGQGSGVPRGNSKKWRK